MSVICQLNVVEDEIHFLTVCPLFDDLRVHYNITCLSNISSFENFRILMTDSDVNHLRNLCRFLSSAEKRRNEYLTV